MDKTVRTSLNFLTCTSNAGRDEILSLVVLGVVRVILAGIFRDMSHTRDLCALGARYRCLRRRGPLRAGRDQFVRYQAIRRKSECALDTWSANCHISYGGVRNKAMYCPAVDRLHAFTHGIYQPRQKQFDRSKVTRAIMIMTSAYLLNQQHAIRSCIRLSLTDCMLTPAGCTKLVRQIGSGEPSASLEQKQCSMALYSPSVDDRSIRASGGRRHTKLDSDGSTDRKVAYLHSKGT